MHAQPGACEHKGEEDEPADVVAAEELEAGIIYEKEPYGSADEHRQPDVRHRLTEVGADEIYRHVVEHDAADEPVVPRENDVEQAVMAGEEERSHQRGGYDRRVNPVDTALVPVGEAFQAVHGLEEEGETRAEEKQSVADGAARGEVVEAPIE